MLQANSMIRLALALAASVAVASSAACGDSGGSTGGGTGGGGAPPAGPSLRILSAPSVAQVASVPWFADQSGPVSVEVVDAEGTRIASLDSGTVAVELLTGTGAFGGTTSAAIHAGVATFHNLTYDTAEPIEVRFVDPLDELEPTGAVAVTLTEPTGSLAVVDGPAAEQVSGVPWSSDSEGAITVEIRTSAGTLDSTNQTAQVTALLVSGAGELAGTLTETATDGLVTFDDLRFVGTGMVVVRFVDAGSMLAPTPNVTVDVDGGELAIFDWPASVQTVRLPFRTATNASVTVEVRDAAGARVLADDETQVRATVVTGTGELLGTVTRTAENGLATFDDLAYDTVEAISIRFEDIAAVRAPSSNGAVTVGGSLAFVDAPDDPQGIARPFSSGLDGPIVIEVLDAEGVRLASDSTTEIAAELVSGAGVLGGTTVRTAIDGLVVFDDLTYDSAGSIDLRFVEVAGGRAPLIASGIAIEPISRVAYFGISPSDPEEEFRFWLAEILGVTLLPPEPLSPPIQAGRDINSFAVGASPDGRWFYYGADEDIQDVDELHVVDLLDGPPYAAVEVHTNLTAFGANIKSAFMSPDSQRLVYTARSNASAPYELYMVELAGAVPGAPTKISVSPLPAGTQVRTSDVTFSADGLTVSYILTDTDSALGYEQIRVVDLHGGGATEGRVDDALTFRSPVVHLTPDGSKIVWRGDGDTESRMEAYLTLLSEQPYETVRLNDPLCADCSLLDVLLDPTGTVAGYVGDVREDGRYEVVIVDVSGDVPGAPHALTPSSGFTSSAVSSSIRFTPDGSRLLFIGLAGIPEIRIFTAELSDPASAMLAPANGLQTSFPSTGIAAAEFSPDGDDVVFLADFSPGDEVIDAFRSRLEAAPSHVRISQDLDTTSGAVSSFEISPDGDLVVYRADVVDDNEFELWVVDISDTTSTAPQRVNGPLMGLNPNVAPVYEFMPDGRRLLYRASETTLQSELRLASFVDPSDSASFVRTTIGRSANHILVIE